MEVDMTTEETETTETTKTEGADIENRTLTIYEMLDTQREVREAYGASFARDVDTDKEDTE